MLYCTYSWLSSKRSKKHQGKEGAKHSFDSRLEQLLQWRAPPHLRCCLILPRTLPRTLTRCGGATFDGVLVFDEVHKAKNLVPAGAGQKPTATGEAVYALQQAMPLAKLVYVSATG